MGIVKTYKQHFYQGIISKTKNFIYKVLGKTKELGRLLPLSRVYGTTYIIIRRLVINRIVLDHIIINCYYSANSENKVRR